MRPPSYYELSGYGTHYLDLETALAHRGRARAVDLRGAKSPAGIKKLARVMRLELGRGPLPSWIAELEHLRVVKWSGCPKKLPEKLVALPALRELYLEDSDVEDISALAKAGGNLETVCMWRTPFSDNESALIKRVVALPGWEGEGQLERKTAQVVPKTKAALVAAIHSNCLPDGADLTGRDLSGVVIEDAVLAQTKLVRANLSNAVFRRCDFALTELDGAILRGARFEDCYIDWRYRPAAKVDATSVVFTGGSLGLSWNKCTLVDARMEHLEPGPSLTFEACDARRMHLEVLARYESSVDIVLTRSDLRGASVRIDLTAERRAELEAKPNPRLTWKPIVTRGAKTDSSTVIEHVALPAKGRKPEKSKYDVDVKGAKAAALGTLAASNASLWMLAIDAKAAAAWTGSDGKDFDRAMDVESGEIAVGAATGILAQIGDCGISTVWEIPGGIALLEHRASGRVRRGKELDVALGLRVAQWKSPGKPSVIGKLSIESGVLALLLPYASGKLTAKQLATLRPLDLEDRFLAPLPNGTYEVTVQGFAPEPRFEDQLGTYGSIVKIVQSKRSSASKRRR